MKLVVPEDKLILRPKPFKTIMFAVTSLLFVAGGIFILKEEVLKGRLITLFFGVCFLIFVIQLIPGSTQLSLTKEGFTTTSLFRSHFTDWSDIEQFEVGYVGKSKFVKFDYKANHKKTQNRKRNS